MLGLATTVGVAWLFAGVEVLGNNMVTTDEQFLENVRFRIVESPGANAVYIWGSMDETQLNDLRAVLPEWLTFSTSDIGKEIAVVEDARGWPWPCLRCRWDMTEIISPLIYDHPVHGGIKTPQFTAPEFNTGGWNFELMGRYQLAQCRALPLLPIWRALILNTLVWSGFWLVISATLVSAIALKRWRRQRKSRCVKCGYDQRGVERERCSECGWENTKRFPVLSTGRMVTLATLVFLVLLLDGAGVVAATVLRFHPPLIHAAAYAGDLKGLQREMDQGTPVDLRIKDGQAYMDGSTSLMWAARSGQAEAIRLLLNARADPDLLDDEDQATALHWAARLGHTKALGALIEGGADLDAQDQYNMTPLNQACYSQAPIESVRVLIEAGADLNHVDRLGSTPLTHAAHFEQEGLIRLLLEAGADPGIDAPIKPIVWSLRKGQLESARLLMEAGGAEGLSNAELLDHAVLSDNMECVLLLFGEGKIILPTYKHGKGTPLHTAVGNLSVEMVRFLIEHGADPTIQGYLDLTAEEQLRDQFGDEDPDDDPRARKILILLSRHEILLDLHPYRTLPKSYTQTPLLSGLREGDAAQVRTGIATGAALRIPSDTLFRYAVYGGNPTCVRLLLDDGFPLPRVRPGEKTLLHYAVASASPKMIHFLLGLGIDPDIKDKHDLTALETARLLLNGPNPSAGPGADLGAVITILENMSNEAEDAGGNDR